MRGLWIAQIIDPEMAPEPTGDWSVEPQAFIALMLAGFVIGIVGHIYRSKTAVATGILMIFLATFGIPVFLHLTR